MAFSIFYKKSNKPSNSSIRKNLFIKESHYPFLKIPRSWYFVKNCFYILCLICVIVPLVYSDQGFEQAARKLGKHKLRVWLVISSSGLKIIDEKTGVRLPEVSFFCPPWSPHSGYLQNSSFLNRGSHCGFPVDKNKGRITSRTLWTIVLDQSLSDFSNSPTFQTRLKVKTGQLWRIWWQVMQ